MAKSILPRVICERRDWSAGTRLVVEDTAGGVLLSPALQFSATTSDQVFASLPFPGTPKTIEEMDAGVLAQEERRHARNRYKHRVGYLTGDHPS